MTSVYFKGIPTEPDLQKLLDKYPHTEMKAGQIIYYDDVETILNTDKKSARFWTITTKWRNTLQSKFGFIVDTVSGEGFKILSEKEKVGFGGRKLKSAGNMAKKAYHVFSVTDVMQLDDPSKSEYNSAVRRTVAILHSQKLKPRIAPPTLAETAI